MHIIYLYNLSVKLEGSVTDMEITAGEAHITVNDQLIPTNLTDLNTRAGYQKTVPVELKLTRGEENTIKFGAIGSEG